MKRNDLEKRLEDIVEYVGEVNEDTINSIF